MRDLMLPRPDRFFEWRSTPSGPALVCPALDRWAPHLFTTRHWPLGGPTAGAGDASLWAPVAEAMHVPPMNLVRLNQVHGSAVSEADPRGEPRSADVLITDDPALAIAVQGADCVPLLLADSRSGAVAAVHAGWRGLAAHVPAVAIQAMAGRYDTRPSDLVAALGPSIGACCYEVGCDVREAFVSAGCSTAELEAWFSEASRPTPENPSMAGVSRGRADHWFFDGWKATRDQLRSAGVRADRIFSAKICTASHPGAMCSYRRDGSPAGRIAGAIRCGRRRP